jgi:hypothetical protein
MIIAMKHLTRRPFLRALLVPAVAAAGLALFSAAPASAQVGPELLIKPFPKDVPLEASASAAFLNKGHARGTDADFQLSVYKAEGRYRLTAGEEASPRVGFSFTYLDMDSDIIGLPQRAIDQSVGVALPIGKIDDWIFGLSVGVGYAGDSFFGDGDAFYGRGTIGAFKKLSETDSLVLAIDYNGNRTFKPDVPLPGVAYIKRIQSNLLLTVGLPVTSIEWEPVENVRVEFAYLLTDNITARVGYQVGNGIELFGAAAQRSEGFFLDNLPGDNQNRLLFQQRYAEAGITYRTRDAGVGDRDLELTAAIGYAWDGEFSTGFDQSDSDLLADVSDEAYIRFGMQLRF